MMFMSLKKDILNYVDTKLAEGHSKSHIIKALEYVLRKYGKPRFEFGICSKCGKRWTYTSVEEIKTVKKNKKLQKDFCHCHGQFR